MIRVLRDPAYAKLFSAQLLALLGTGLLTVALALLAFEIAGGDAGVVLGTALAIKMVAYVFVSPVMAAIAVRVPRKTLLIGADLVRAAVAITLPSVGEVWQIYVLVFVLQSASATFTPAFQAVIPQILLDERDYTRALSLSRLAYDLESLVSPILAAALLSLIRFDDLFVGTFVGFIGSAILVALTRFPPLATDAVTRFRQRLLHGTRVFLRARELRSLMAMNLAVSAATAMVVVNTVVLVQDRLGRPQTDTALLLAAYGAGSMSAALVLPRVLDRLSDRTVMLTGTAGLPTGLLLCALLVGVTGGAGIWELLLGLWAFLGAATALVLTPSARLLRRASDETERPAVYAAQFSLSHAAFLISYPLAGMLGAALGLPAAALVLATIAAGAATAAATVWRVPGPRSGA